MGNSKEVARSEICNSNEDFCPEATKFSSAENRSGWGSMSKGYCPASADFGGERSVVEGNCVPDEAGTVSRQHEGGGDTTCGGLNRRGCDQSVRQKNRSKLQRRIWASAGRSQ